MQSARAREREGRDSRGGSSETRAFVGGLEGVSSRDIVGNAAEPQGNPYPSRSRSPGKPSCLLDIVHDFEGDLVTIDKQKVVTRRQGGQGTMAGESRACKTPPITGADRRPAPQPPAPGRASAWIDERWVGCALGIISCCMLFHALFCMPRCCCSGSRGVVVVELACVVLGCVKLTTAPLGPSHFFHVTATQRGLDSSWIASRVRRASTGQSRDFASYVFIDLVQRRQSVLLQVCPKRRRRPPRQSPPGPQARSYIARKSANEFTHTHHTHTHTHHVGQTRARTAPRARLSGVHEHSAHVGVRAAPRVREPRDAQRRGQDAVPGLGVRRRLGRRRAPRRRGKGRQDQGRGRLCLDVH